MFHNTRVIIWVHAYLCYITQMTHIGADKLVVSHRSQLQDWGCMYVTGKLRDRTAVNQTKALWEGSLNNSNAEEF